MYPVFIYQEGLELPAEGIYYVVAGNGLWLHKDMGIIKAFVPVENISILPDLNALASVQCNLPKVPAKLVRQTKTFFEEITLTEHTEANVLLFFSKKEQRYRPLITRQSASHGGVNYHRPGLSHVDDYLLVASIHSHCDFSAFHSGTDHADEHFFDGFHCTFGNNDQDAFTIAASIVINGHRSPVDPLTLLEGISEEGGKFTLSPEECPEGEDEIEDWLSQFRGIKAGIAQGDFVEWAGDLTTVSFKSVCGGGPFLVDAVGEGWVMVNTNVGLARFSDKLFKKVE